MVDADESSLTLAADGVIGTVFKPRSGGPLPGVILIGGSDGNEPKLSAQRLAQEGFATLSVAYFKREGLPPTLRDVPLEYFERALRALQRSVAPRSPPLAVLGVSRGSEAALLSGVYFPDLVNAVIGLVPGNVVLCSWPPGSPAWTLKGEALPYVSRFGPTSPIPEAVIPVEKIRGPVLLISGGADSVWPSSAMAAAMASRLKARSHPYPDELVDYPLAGHFLGRVASPASPRAAPEPSSENLGARPGPEAVLGKVCEFLRRLPQAR